MLQHCKWLKSEPIHLKSGKQPVATNTSVAIQVLRSPSDLAETSGIPGRHVRMAHLHQRKGITKYGQKRAILINKQMPDKIRKDTFKKIWLHDLNAKWLGYTKNPPQNLIYIAVGITQPFRGHDFSMENPVKSCPLLTAWQRHLGQASKGAFHLQLRGIATQTQHLWRGKVKRNPVDIGMLWWFSKWYTKYDQDK